MRGPGELRAIYPTPDWPTTLPPSHDVIQAASLQTLLGEKTAQLAASAARVAMLETELAGRDRAAEEEKQTLERMLDGATVHTLKGRDEVRRKLHCLLW